MPFIENNASGLVYMTSDLIAAAHAFTTRRGGVSGGIYESLNLRMGVGDENQNVLRNFELLGAAIGFNPNGLVFSHQVHGTEVRCVTASDCQAPSALVPYEADGLITADKGVPIIIFTADCVPILLFDPVGCAIGAVHAGWRGTVRDIAGKAVRQMAESFGCRPADIRAAIGPCISSCCYETERDVADAVSALGDGAEKYAVPKSGKFMVDLKGLNAHLLKRAGLSSDNLDISPECTSCRSDKYWSHRVTHGRRGSQASVIMMKGSTI